MAQVNVYVPNTLAAEIRRQARRAGVSLSQYISNLLQRRTGKAAQWPKNFFTDVVGQWHGPFPEIPREPAEEPETL